MSSRSIPIILKYCSGTMKSSHICKTRVSFSFDFPLHLTSTCCVHPLKFTREKDFTTFSLISWSTEMISFKYCAYLLDGSAICTVHLYGCCCCVVISRAGRKKGRSMMSAQMIDLRVYRWRPAQREGNSVRYRSANVSTSFN